MEVPNREEKDQTAFNFPIQSRVENIYRNCNGVSQKDRGQPTHPMSSAPKWKDGRRDVPSYSLHRYVLLCLSVSPYISTSIRMSTTHHKRGVWPPPHPGWLLRTCANRTCAWPQSALTERFFFLLLFQTNRTFILPHVHLTLSQGNLVCGISIGSQMVIKKTERGSNTFVLYTPPPQKRIGT